MAKFISVLVAGEVSRTGATALVLSSVLSRCDSAHDQAVCSLPIYIQTNEYCSLFVSVLSGTVIPARALLCAVGLVFCSFGTALL